MTNPTDDYLRGYRAGAEAMREAAAQYAYRAWDDDDAQQMRDEFRAIPLPDAPARDVSVAEAREKTISDLMTKHDAYIRSKGRNPDDYASRFSLAASALRTLAGEDGK